MTLRFFMPSHTEISGLQSRQLASYLLKAVLQDKRPFDDAFAGSGAKAAFSGLAFRDRAFSRAIAATALRRLGQIEDMLRRFLERPLPADAFEARFILIAGAAQLAFMDVAPHAAIGLAVEQAKATRAATPSFRPHQCGAAAREQQQGGDPGGPGRRRAEHAGVALAALGPRIMARRRRKGSQLRMLRSRRWTYP